MVKKKNNKNVYNFTLYFKIKLFLHHIYLITPSVYKARSYAATMSLFWSERQQTLLHLVIRDVHIINSLNNFEIFINDHTMSRVTNYFFFRYWLQKC